MSTKKGQREKDEARRSATGVASPGKRLARAKVASGGGDGARRAHRPSPSDRLGSKRRVRGIVIAVFAIIMGVAMMLPSLSYIFASKGASSSDAASAQQADASSSDDDKGSDGASSDGTSSNATDGMTGVDNQYGAMVASLESQLSGDQGDSQKMITLLGLGDDYAKWASAASSYATDDSAKTHVSDLYDKAIGYYNQYLSLNDSNAVKVKIAQCNLYNANVTEAVLSLERLTQDSPDYAPAWLYLGVAYADQGDGTKATNAFKKAEDTDPDNSYGAKSLAQSYEAYLASATGSTPGTDASGSGASSGATDASTTATTSGGSSLMDKLNSSAGTSL